MVANKIICNSQILIDLTEDTVIPEKLGYGLTAHDKSGNIITGICAIPMDPLHFDHNIGYVDNGTWKYQNPTRTYCDIYQVQAGNTYFFTLGGNVGSRFRAMFTTTDITLVSSGQVVGTRLVNVNNPATYANGVLNCTNDGYLIIAKDNVGKQNVKTYVYNATLAWL